MERTCIAGIMLLLVIPCVFISACTGPEGEGPAAGVKVSVGSVPHPMEEKHYIEWIELVADGKAYRQFLKPGDRPEAEFPVSASQLFARELCNLHGLWKA